MPNQPISSYLLLDALALEGAADADVDVAPGAQEVVGGGVVLAQRPPRPRQPLLVQVQLLVAQPRRADALARASLDGRVAMSIEHFSLGL